MGYYMDHRALMTGFSLIAELTRKEMARLKWLQDGAMTALMSYPVISAPWGWFDAPPSLGGALEKIGFVQCSITESANFQSLSNLAYSPVQWSSALVPWGNVFEQCPPLTLPMSIDCESLSSSCVVPYNASSVVGDSSIALLSNQALAPLSTSLVSGNALSAATAGSFDFATMCYPWQNPVRYSVNWQNCIAGSMNIGTMNTSRALEQASNSSLALCPNASNVTSTISGASTALVTRQTTEFWSMCAPRHDMCPADSISLDAAANATTNAAAIGTSPYVYAAAAVFFVLWVGMLYYDARQQTKIRQFTDFKEKKRSDAFKYQIDKAVAVYDYKIKGLKVVSTVTLVFTVASFLSFIMPTSISQVTPVLEVTTAFATAKQDYYPFYYLLKSLLIPLGCLFDLYPLVSIAQIASIGGLFAAAVLVLSCAMAVLYVVKKQAFFDLLKKTTDLCPGIKETLDFLQRWSLYCLISPTAAYAGISFLIHRIGSYCGRDWLSDNEGLKQYDAKNVEHKKLMDDPLFLADLICNRAIDLQLLADKRAGGVGVAADIHHFIGDVLVNWVKENTHNIYDQRGNNKQDPAAQQIVKDFEQRIFPAIIRLGGATEQNFKNAIRGDLRYWACYGIDKMEKNFGSGRGSSSWYASLFNRFRAAPPPEFTAAHYTTCVEQSITKMVAGSLWTG